MLQRPLRALALVLSLAPAAPALAQGPRMPDSRDLTVDAKAKGEVIDRVIAALDKDYVFPETASKMAADLRHRQEAKEYDKITSGREFARKLTDDLRSVSKDKHLGVRFSFEPIAAPKESSTPGGPSPEERAEMAKFAARVNYGFERVERLEGNVGYLNLRGFMPPDIAGETASAAMTFLANSDALILDMRQNGGGDPAMVAFLSTYLFDGEPVHLNDLYFRPDDSTHQWWTLPHVPGKRFGGKKPVYVLTSERTFSAAEEFTYNLKNLKRATIVGETTGGGAHPGGTQRMSEHFEAFIPNGRAINPISKSNWEGTGIAPDIATRADAALKTAHASALERLLKDAQAQPGGLDPMMTEEFRKTIDRLKKEVEESRGRDKAGDRGEGKRSS